MAIKGLAVADFIAEFTCPIYTMEEIEDEDKTLMLPKKQRTNPYGPIWMLHIDGASNKYGSEVGVVLANPNGGKLKYSLSFKFQTSNNEAEYEALQVGISQARKLKA